MELSGVAGESGKTRLKNQSEKVIRVFAQDGVRLRLCEWKRSHQLANPSHVVALVHVERREHEVGLKGHRREELDAVDLPLGGEQHYTCLLYTSDAADE